MSSVTHDSETPAKGQQVITAVAVIHQKIDGVEKIFLPKRAKTKKFLPDVFELPGGHIDFGEDLEVGLKRELLEEFNMNIEVGDPFAAFTYTNDVKGSHSIEVVYFAKFVESIDKISFNPEDHSEYTWIGEDEMNQIYSEQKGEEDIEYKCVKKAFSILNGDGVNTL